MNDEILKATKVLAVPEPYARARDDKAIYESDVAYQTRITHTPEA